MFVGQKKSVFPDHLLQDHAFCTRRSCPWVVVPISHYVLDKAFYIGVFSAHAIGRDDVFRSFLFPFQSLQIVLQKLEYRLVVALDVVVVKFWKFHFLFHGYLILMMTMLG
ncbi:MAG: hypothetical protein BGO63_03650 [Candidatus Accumulibacter sp. 66-26]|nr:MAG: hypothetical protein BGO63_03650 [Candidatus Accumulibacter sp. 66-26]